MLAFEQRCPTVMKCSQSQSVAASPDMLVHLFTDFNGERKSTQVSGAVWMITRVMSGMTCGGIKCPMKTGISAKSSHLGSLSLDPRGALPYDFSLFGLPY